MGLGGDGTPKKRKQKPSNTKSFVELKFFRSPKKSKICRRPSQNFCILALTKDNPTHTAYKRDTSLLIHSKAVWIGLRFLSTSIPDMQSFRRHSLFCKFWKFQDFGKFYEGLVLLGFCLRFYVHFAISPKKEFPWHSKNFKTFLQNSLENRMEHTDYHSNGKSVQIKKIDFFLKSYRPWAAIFLVCSWIIKVFVLLFFLEYGFCVFNSALIQHSTAEEFHWKAGKVS